MQQQLSKVTVIHGKARRHGFEAPFSVFQLASWVVAAFIFISTCLSAISILQRDEGSVPNGDKIFCGIILGLYLLAYLVMVVTTVIVTKSDPTDPTIALERLARVAKKNKFAKLDFNPADYQFYCDVCDTHVLKNTKHCQRCNRCAYDFDHHCVWVSNDIGMHNYIDFIRMLTSVLLTVIMQLVFCSYTLATISVSDSVGLMSKGSLKALNWTTLVVSLILLLLDTYLLTFHIYLICKNTSTYKHIRK